MHRSLIALALVAAIGCSSESPAPTPTPVAKQAEQADLGDSEAIRVASERFLKSVVSGDAAEAIRWLTPKAAKRAQNDPSVFAPLGFSATGLEVAEVRVIAEDEAAAQCWVAETGADDREELCCLLKRGSLGWRVCGIACEAGPGEEPAVISFESTVAPGGSAQPNRDRFVEQAPAQEVRTAADPSSEQIR